jgi:hypothetical protein
MLAVTLVQYRNSSKVTKYSNQHDRRLLKIEAISYPRSRMWITYGNMVVTTNKQTKTCIFHKKTNDKDKAYKNALCKLKKTELPRYN